MRYSDLTNIVTIVEKGNAQILDVVCADCAERIYGAIEGVELQPVYTFENLERDSPEHCSSCDVLLEWDMTDEGLEYVRAEIVEHLGKYGYLSETLQTWHDAYGDYIKEGTRFNNTLTSSQVDEILDAESVTEHYLVAQVWSGTLDYMTGTYAHGGESLTSGPLDSVVGSIHELSGEIWESARKDVDSFIESVEPFLAYFGETELTAEQLGHDLSLTRNHHGAGFWDRGYGDLGAWLTHVSHDMGECSLYGAIQLIELADDVSDTSLDQSNLDLESLSIWESD